MAYSFLNPSLGLDTPASTGTVQKWYLGREEVAQETALRSAVSAPVMGKFVYVAGSDIAAAGNLVGYPGYSALAMSDALSASRMPLGFAGGPMTATNVYGWVQVQGIVTNACFTTDAVAAGVPLYLHAGAGQLASAFVAGNHILGCYAYSAVAASVGSASSASVHINYPEVVGLTASN